MAKILVVDDQPSITWLLNAILSTEGHVVITAHGGPEASALVGVHRPDLVITDVKMPTLNGFELVQQIRDVFPEMKCIMMSGNADFSDPETLAETRRLQVAATLTKPFLMGQLLEIVDQVLSHGASFPVSLRPSSAPVPEEPSQPRE
jgi:DNA-binding NtrC family response regulator